ncbi:tRNA (adenine57-N1/adenine58-N1)-methyltransferase catalytic subunit, partial [Lecanoromycetidae sp. Uapishka_2]
MVISHPSPFLECGFTAEADALAVLHLKRDLLLPTLLRSQDELHEGYDEGKVTNTRFGSFPHSTLIGIPWGSQVRASAVDTGSRGRKGWEGSGKKGQKRKREHENHAGVDDAKKVKTADPSGNAGSNIAVESNQDHEVERKVAVEATSGFVHILPPTPEVWTASLPHRTQVVYTPDYSYVLHRIRARPGTVLIEAGAGSGSFTHAAARAVYSGSSQHQNEDPCEGQSSEGRRGKVYSFEFHEQRAEKLRAEIREHGLDDVVELTHRDVCQDGFAPNSTSPSQMRVNAIFLDLPAPWLALKHLIRSSSSPLDSHTAIHICTFSPCIEQVQRTITTLRSLGWLEIEMVEIAAKRIEVRRERVGLQEEGLRGVNDSPASVDEALTRLREVEGRSKIFHEESAAQDARAKRVAESPAARGQISKQQRLENIRNALETRKLYKEGRLLHKAEPELKTHTSYLVFAILPREWTDEDESEAQEQWPDKAEVGEQKVGSLSTRQRKKEAKTKAGGNKASEMEGRGSDAT